MNEHDGSFPAVCPSCGLIAILLRRTVDQEGAVHVLLRRVAPGNSSIEKLGEYILQLHRNYVLASNPEVELDIYS